MGKAIVVSLTIVIITVAVIWAIRRSWSDAHQVGDLNLKQERDLRRMVHNAAEVMRRLEASRNDINDFDLLSDESRENVAQWLRDYAVFQDKNKEINA